MVKYLNVPLDDEVKERLSELKGERTWQEFFRDIAEEEK